MNHKRTRKTLLALSVVAVLGATILTGCGSPNPAVATPATTAAVSPSTAPVVPPVPTPTPVPTLTPPPTETAAEDAVTTVEAPAPKEFTAEALSKYDGKNGAAAYIAVDGVVYDVSGYFKNGTHNGAVAGKDQTAAFYDEHGKSKLELARVVGSMKTDVKPAAKPSALPEPAVSAPAAAPTPSAAVAATQKEFTTEELATYDGKNGAAAYIAVDGVVYDVSGYFKNGTHNGAAAGKDQTAAFYGEHSKSKLNQATVMGVMAGSGAAVATKTDTQSNTALTAEEQTQVDALRKELAQLEQQDYDIELQEDTLKASYRSGKLTADEYRAQKLKLEKQDDARELKEDEIERQLRALGVDDHDYD